MLIQLKGAYLVQGVVEKGIFYCAKEAEEFKKIYIYKRGELRNMESYVKLFIAFLVSIIICFLGWTILNYYQTSHYADLILNLVGSIVLVVGILFLFKFTIKWIKELWKF